jgi:hypothetical protein
MREIGENVVRNARVCYLRVCWRADTSMPTCRVFTSLSELIKLLDTSIRAEKI